MPKEAPNSVVPLPRLHSSDEPFKCTVFRVRTGHTTFLARNHACICGSIGSAGLELEKSDVDGDTLSDLRSTRDENDQSKIGGASDNHSVRR
jgi:hypothetical protein